MPSYRVTIDRGCPRHRNVRPASWAPGRREPPEGKREPSGIVLYVEDNRVNFLLVEQLLRIWSLVELHHAEDGATALEVARAVQPDLVILDLHLPDMNGLEVLRRLREEPAFARARVAILSASVMPGDVAAAREAGAVEYWTKPLHVHRFLKDVQRLLKP
jgi:CheY-like chemotaxis protein